MAFSEAIIYLFNFSLGMAAVLAFIVIVAAGIKMVESRGNPSETQDAKQKIINSLLGLTILLTSYILLTTINPDLVKIENISLGTTGITIPIITPGDDPEDAKNYQFEEIPIGTLTEAILIGTSSTKNKVPCYEYEHEAYDDDGQLIIANTVDKNKDGKITEKDIILNKDMFYCIKLLDDAIKKKIEVHLNTLIAGQKQLDALMKTNCTCKRAYYSYLPPHEEEYKIEGSDCSNTGLGCWRGTTYCQCCGGANTGCSRLDPYNTSCSSSSLNPCEIVGYNNGKEVKQYQYDTCDNRLAINCKKQEIKQLMDGSKPDQICYEEVNGQPPLIKKEQPFNLFTIKLGIERLQEFKDYYDKQIGALEDAELKTKEYGEKLTLAEIYNNVQTKDDVTVDVKEFETDIYYNISRYCRTANCTKSGYDPKLGYVCPEKDNEYEMSLKKRVCRMDVTKEDVESGDVFAASCEKATGLFELDACREFYSYAGDPATFYYGEKYNSDYKGENQVIDSSDDKCNLETQIIENEMYGGVIRIGETVDYTQAWGKEVSRRIEKLKEEVQGMFSTGMAISNFPDSCSAGNCTNSSPDTSNICIHPKCDCDDKYCCCAGVDGRSCQKCEPFETVCDDPEEEQMDQMGHVSSCLIKETKSYGGCSSCCEEECPKVPKPEEDYWTCPYRNLCNLMKNMYQEREIQRSCLEETEDTNEEKSREIMKSKVGYVQKMEMREVILFEMAQVKEIKDDVEYEKVSTTDLIGLVCPDYLRWQLTPLTCNASLNKKLNIEKRFDLFDMLKDSRERLNGCVKGYTIPYKQTADNVRVLSCYEASNTSNTGLVVIPEFPFLKLGDPVDEDIAEGIKYINCYPYNSDNLTDQEKEVCFYNINRTGTAENPGCLTITKNYMDNYYCCQ